MKNRMNLFLVVLAVMMMLVSGVIVFLMLRASGISIDLGMKEVELNYDPIYGADNGFIVNPYQIGGNPDRNQALIIGASVSYILREVKAFTMFAVVLTVLALFTYVIIAFIALNKIARPIVKAAEPAKKEEAKMMNEEYVSDNNNSSDSGGKEPNGCIDDKDYSAAFLSRNIDEMLSEIDAAMEKSKIKWAIFL